MANNPYDLEQRTYLFAKNIAFFCRSIPRSIINNEYIKQLVRSSASVGANYIEANESLGEKDFKMKIKICRKEAKESAYWLQLISSVNGDIKNIDGSHDEATQLKKIFSAILQK